MSTMHTLFESAEEFSSSEISDELITALAAGQWWAIVEASVLISEHPEYGYLISGQWGETVETGETSCPTSLVFSDVSEKADSGDGPKLKTPEPLRQELLQQKPKAFLQGPPMPDNISERQKQKILEPEIAPVCCSQGAPVINTISERSTEASVQQPSSPSDNHFTTESGNSEQASVQAPADPEKSNGQRRSVSGTSTKTVCGTEAQQPSSPSDNHFTNEPGNSEQASVRVPANPEKSIGQRRSVSGTSTKTVCGTEVQQPSSPSDNHFTTESGNSEQTSVQVPADPEKSNG
ncbi:unnamed protein product [Leuciscus chuanchicus]